MSANDNPAMCQARRRARYRRSARLAALAACATVLLGACSSHSTKGTTLPAAPVTGPASAPASAPAATPGALTGTWSGRYSGSYHGTFTLRWRQSGMKLSGTIKLSNPPGTLPIHGRVRGDAIRFGTVGSVGVTYTGTVNGDSMSGTYHVGPVSSNGGPWSASKVSR